ncbi:MAG: metallophosphoesterase family protein [Ruminococcus sp.]|nr:metallophosphoesterase family protein [Ruminococcus sp.]
MNTEKTKKPLSKRGKIILIALAVIMLLMLAEVIRSNSIVEVESFEYKSPDIPESFDGVKIVSVTDYHNHGGSYEDKLIEKIKEQQPDYIFLVGDLVDSRRTDIEQTGSFFKKCAAIAPCYLCLGNHEVSVFAKGGRDEYMKYADEAGITVLENCAVTLERGSGSLTLLGTSNALESTVLDSVLVNRDTSAPLLWIHHYPEDFEEESEAAASLGYSNTLMFCGHAHGGLIRIPFTGQGLYAPGQGLFPKYTGGEYQSGSGKMLLSRGCGNSGYSLSLFDPFEIVVCTLRSK